MTVVSSLQCRQERPDRADQDPVHRGGQSQHLLQRHRAHGQVKADREPPARGAQGGMHCAAF